VGAPLTRDHVLAGVPENGDVVIRRPGSERSCIVGCVPGPDQIRCATRADAERVAGSYAEHARVNAWAAESPNGFTLVAHFRRSIVAAGAEARSRPTETNAP